MPNAIFIAGRNGPAREGLGASAPRAASFAALVERHAQFVYRIALAVTRHPQDAEDAVQETFLQVFRGNRWEEIEEERGYLARVAWRLAVRQGKPRMQERELPPELQSARGSPEESAMERQQEAWLHARIDALPEKLRQPLALHALGELKLVEIAAILGLPEGTVRRRVHSARERLKLELAEWNSTLGREESHGR
jgi:RNA polymerase sigma-70 factor (ECF subfamily)